MPKVLEPGEPYTGRAPGVVAVNLTMDRAAYELLKQEAPGKKAYGRFLSRLVYEHCARLEVRRQGQKQLIPLLGEEMEDTLHAG
jgi:hypothetical protein